MTPEHVEAARRVAVARVDEATNGTAFGVVETLDRAGMLRTGLEKRAVEACEVAAQQLADRATAACRFCKEPAAVGRESLALKQPPRWKRTQDSQGVHFIEKGSRQLYVHQLSEPERERICAALNACDTEAPQ